MVTDIAQWSQWRAYRKAPPLFRTVPSLTPMTALSHNWSPKCTYRTNVATCAATWRTYRQDFFCTRHYKPSDVAFCMPIYIGPCYSNHLHFIQCVNILYKPSIFVLYMFITDEGLMDILEFVLWTFHLGGFSFIRPWRRALQSVPGWLYTHCSQQQHDSIHTVTTPRSSTTSTVHIRI